MIKTETDFIMNQINYEIFSNPSTSTVLPLTVVFLHLNTSRRILQVPRFSSRKGYACPRPRAPWLRPANAVTPFISSPLHPRPGRRYSGPCSDPSQLLPIIWVLGSTPTVGLPRARAELSVTLGQRPTYTPPARVKSSDISSRLGRTSLPQTRDPTAQHRYRWTRLLQSLQTYFIYYPLMIDASIYVYTGPSRQI